MNCAPSKPSSKGNTMPATPIRLDASQNIDGTVDVLINGRHIDGGDDLPVVDLVGVLGAYAKVNGPLLVTTRLLDGSTTTDKVGSDGIMSPYYPSENRAPVRAEVQAQKDPSFLFRALAEQPAGRAIDPTPVWAEATVQKTYAPPRTESSVPVVGEVPMFDVEGDIMRDLEARAAPAKNQARGNAVRLAAVVAGILLGGIVLFLLLPQML
jgi:hypothetical protein